jgi:photosystem II stability/assembly factor-like uncharacterized protein
MKLLSPNTGWITYNNKLYWTNDGGDHWMDITPAPPGIKPAPPGLPRAGASFSSVFFRDTSEGWVVVSYTEQIPVPTPQALGDARTLYTIGHTVDSGTSWTFAPLTYPALPQWLQDTLAGPTDLYFLDSMHGWLDVAFEGNLKPGKLLATEDGGRTWKWVNSPPVSGPIMFLSLQDGWLVSNFGADQLYVTHDGANIWQEIRLSPPPQIEPTSSPRFQSPPFFPDQREGFLVVHYSGSPSKLVIYSSKDSGKTWQPIKVLTEAQGAEGARFAIVDSNIVVSTGSSAGNIGTKSLALLGGGSSDVNASDRGVIALTFGDAANGWALSADGRLLATHDGGATWKDISPSHAPSLPVKTFPAQKGLAANVTETDLLSSSLETLASSGGSGGPHLSKHLGFDMSYVRSISDMATWWKYSPYYDTHPSIFLARPIVERTPM